MLSVAADKPLIGLSNDANIIITQILRATEQKHELFLICIAMIIGAFWDSFLVWQGWLSYSSGFILTNAAPYWIIILWGLFATTLNVSMRYLKHKIIIAALFGGVAGPLAYYAGQRLGAVIFLDTNIAIVSLSIGWAIFTPLLLRLSLIFDGYQTPELRRTV